MQRISSPLFRTFISRPFLTTTKSPLIRQSIYRPYTTAKGNYGSSKSTLPIKTISASIMVTSAFYLYGSSVAQAEAATKTLGVIDELQDKENRIAVHAKSTEELAMGLFVYRLCAIPYLADFAPTLLSIAERLGLEAPVYWFVKNTFFRHFCGGETSEECIDRMERLAQSGISCILDLSVEADLHTDPSEQQQTKYARDEKNADVILEMLLRCIQTAAQSPTQLAMVAVKVTGLAPPELLLRLNHAVNLLDQQFLKLQRDGLLYPDDVSQVIENTLPPAESPEQDAQRRRVVELLKQNDTVLNVIEFRKLFNLQGPGRDIWWRTAAADSVLTMEDLEAYDRVVSRLDKVCKMAHDEKVGVMIDAEQSYFQDIIDHVALNLQRKFNQRNEENQQPTVFNTYQMYTKSSRGRLELDVEVSKRENFTFAAKLVRGAYMVSERKRANEMGYPSPIHDTLEDTHTSYNEGVKFLLKELKEYQEANNTSVDLNTSPVVFMVASHNRESIILTLEEMEKNKVLARSGVVLFGQLYGMQDQISYTLGRHGCAIYKYLPYGKINEVIPYLVRRAQENSSVLGGVGIERQLMWQELKNRLTGKQDVSITTSPTTSV